MRPDPIKRIDTAFFWEACEQRKFVVQKCEPCNTLWHPPRPMCPKCHSIEKTHQRLTGRGVVISWVKQVRPASYGFESSPFVILVELDEGLRIVSNLISVSVPVIGDIVEVDFERTIGGKSVPIFKRVVV